MMVQFVCRTRSSSSSSLINKCIRMHSTTTTTTTQWTKNANLRTMFGKYVDKTNIYSWNSVIADFARNGDPLKLFTHSLHCANSLFTQIVPLSLAPSNHVLPSPTSAPENRPTNKLSYLGTVRIYLLHLLLLICTLNVAI
jgi:hypothetical protein